MLRVFSKKRRQATLPGTGKMNPGENPGRPFFRVLSYALGEIAITVVGILLALWVNNWNEERQLDQQFNNRLPKLYHEILRENQTIESSIRFNEMGLEYLDSLLLFPEKLETKKALFYTALFCIEFAGTDGSNQIPEDFRTLQPNPERQDQLELSHLIAVVWNSDFQFVRNPRLRKLFEENHFPIPELGVFLSLKTRPERMAGRFFSEEDMAHFETLRKTRPFLNALKTERGNLEANNASLIIRLNNGLQAMKAIKAYRPDVKAGFEEIGVVGDAVGSWDESVPMRLKPGAESTWELELTLKKGFLKFRSHNTWEENWGGYQFPSGKAVTNGDDIPVQAGRYRIELDLVMGEYAFRAL